MPANPQQITQQVLEQLQANPRSINLALAPVASSSGRSIQVQYSQWGTVRGAETTGPDGVNRHFKSQLQVIRRGRQQPIIFVANMTFYRSRTPLLRVSMALCPKGKLLSFGIAEKTDHRVEKVLTVTLDKSHAHR